MPLWFFILSPSPSCFLIGSLSLASTHLSKRSFRCCCHTRDEGFPKSSVFCSYTGKNLQKVGSLQIQAKQTLNGNLDKADIQITIWPNHNFYCQFHFLVTDGRIRNFAETILNVVPGTILVATRPRFQASQVEPEMWHQQSAGHWLDKKRRHRVTHENDSFKKKQKTLFLSLEIPVTVVDHVLFSLVT